MNARRLLAGLLLLTLAAGVALCALTSARFPWSGGDFVGIWGLKARALLRSGGELHALVRVDTAHPFMHPEYPPLWPILLAACSAATGGWDPLRLWFLWPILCLAAAALAIRSTRASTPYRLLAGAFLAWLPYCREGLYCGYAEALLVPLVLAAVAEAEGLSGTRSAVRLGCLLALAAATKQEGLLASAVVCAILVLDGARRRFALVAGAVVLLMVEVPWIAFLRSNAPELGVRDFSLRSFDPAHLAAAAGFLLREVVVPNALWILGAAALLAMAPGVRRRRRARILGAGIYVTALYLSMAFTKLDPVWHLRWTWDRLVLVPLTVLIPVLAEAVAELVELPVAGDSPQSCEPGVSAA